MLMSTARIIGHWIVGHVIWTLFKVRYEQSSVWRLLTRMGWSNQRVQRLAIQRDDESVVNWNRRVWPRRKKWRDLKATLVMVDEAGFSLVSPLKRSWSPRGQTPTVRTSLNHHQRLNLFGALLISPTLRNIRLSVRSFQESLCSRHTNIFLKQLLARIAGPIVLIWDNHKIHLSSLVQ
ncbi:MAG: winged helix-turn-helix domain-containing protein [Chloroflexota bacterium]